MTVRHSFWPLLLEMIKTYTPRSEVKRERERERERETETETETERERIRYCRSKNYLFKVTPLAMNTNHNTNNDDDHHNNNKK